MLQFYFLSILLNVLAGLIFIYAMDSSNSTSVLLSDSDSPFTGNDDFDLGEGKSEQKTPEKTSLKSLAIPFLGDKTLQLVVGILSALTGLMKLLSPIQYDIVVIGDLVPSLAGIAAGAVLLLDWYQERTEVELNLPEAIQNVYAGGRKYLGIFCILAAFLHFIFPRVLFL